MVTIQEELRSIVSKRAPQYFDVQQIIARDNGREFGSPVKWIVYDSATTPTLQIQNANAGANAPGQRISDNSGALIFEALKSGVNIGKATTIYPSLTVKDGASGTTNLAVTSTGVVTRPLLKNWNGTTAYFQSDSTEGVFNPQLRVTNGSVDYLKANSTEVLTLTQLRNWNGTIDYLKSTSTELLTRPKLRNWDGTNSFLTSDSTELLVRPKARVWDGTNVYLTSDSTEMLVRPKLRVWDGSADFLTADTATGTLAFTGLVRRITGDLSNATVLNRLLFQTSTANTTTALGVIPSGTGTQSNMNFYNGTDPTACSDLFVGMMAAEARILTIGTGVTTLPLRLYSGGTMSIELDNGKLGFFNTTAIAKPTVTGARGGNAALASVLTELANLGLITDSSTA